MTTTKDEEGDVVATWMQTLSAEPIEEMLKAAQTKLQRQQVGLLMEIGQVHVKQIEEKSLEAGGDRKDWINRCLNAIELYLVIVECCLKKILYFRDLLDPAMNDQDIKESEKYHIMLEKIVAVEHFKINRLYEQTPELRHVVYVAFDKLPLKAFTLRCFET